MANTRWPRPMRTLTNAAPRNPLAPVMNVVAPASPRMRPVWRVGDAANTHSGRTTLVRRPYSCSGKMQGHETCHAVMWRAAQSAARGGGLHAGGAGDDRGPLGSCRERAGARGTTAAP